MRYPVRPALACFAAKGIEGEARRIREEAERRKRELVKSVVEEYSGVEIPLVDRRKVVDSSSPLIAVDFGYGIALEGVKTDQDSIVFFERVFRNGERFQLRLKAMAEVKKALGLKSGATIDEVAALLNTMTDSARLEIKESPPYLVRKRGLDVSVDEAIRRMSTLESDGFWESLLAELSGEVSRLSAGELKERESLLRALSEKFTSHIGEENDYFRIQPGRRSFTTESQQAFLEELEEKNPEMAAKLVKESEGGEGIRIVGEYPLAEVSDLSEDLLGFLERRYEMKTRERAKRESVYREAFSETFGLKL